MTQAANSTRLRVFLAIEETPLFHTDFVEALLRDTHDEIVGAARIVWTPPKANLERYLIRNWYRLRPIEMMRLGWTALAGMADFRGPTVRSVIDESGIPCFDVTKNINAPEYVERIRDCQPDVILSSQAHIFGETLLNLPKICCLNRHASLLPSYAGLWAPFHAYRCGETKTGVSIHTMAKKIDEGIPLAQRRVSCRDDDTLIGLYAKCFDESADAVLEALDRIRIGDLRACTPNGKTSYFAFPTPQHWREFRARGGRLA